MRLLVLLVTTTFASLPNFAFAEACQKDFPNHIIMKDGGVAFYKGVGGGWWYPCSLSATINEVSPEACKAALATYLSAKAQGKLITLSYPGTCAALNADSSSTEGFQWFGVYW